MTKTQNNKRALKPVKNPFASLYDEDDDDVSSTSSTTTTTAKKTKKPAVVTPAPWAKNWTPERKGWAYCSDDEDD